MCMYHSCFIHSSVDGHLGCFHVLPIVNSAAMNNGMPVSFSTLVSSGYTTYSWIREHVGLWCICLTWRYRWSAGDDLMGDHWSRRCGYPSLRERDKASDGTLWKLSDEQEACKEMGKGFAWWGQSQEGVVSLSPGEKWVLERKEVTLGPNITGSLNQIGAEKCWLDLIRHSQRYFFKRLYFRSDPSRITEENKEIFNK